jgi:tetratricopeptide (TPR) repeat protein
LAYLYELQGRNADAEPLVKRSLKIYENSLDRNHPDIARSLNILAELYENQGHYIEAEPLFKRALEIREKTLGPNHHLVATSLNNLAALYQSQGRYADAEPLYKRSLSIREKAVGHDHPDVTTTLNNLALNYEAQGRYGDALLLLKRTLNNTASKDVALFLLHVSQTKADSLVSPNETFADSYSVMQRASSSLAGEAVSKLAARFAAGKDELAQLVRNDQDLTAEANRLDKLIVAAVSKVPTERNSKSEDQIHTRIEDIKSEREQLENIFIQRFPEYAALSKPPPLTVKQTQALLADDEALVVFDFDPHSYAWIITNRTADWTELMGLPRFRGEVRSWDQGI